MNIEQLARSFIDTMGPEWWDAKVANTILNAQIGLNLGLVFFALLFGGTTALVLYLARNRPHEWELTAFIFGGFGYVFSIFPLGVVIGSYAVLQQPEWTVWQEVVAKVGTLVK